ncbi:type VI secretion system tube protein Hcp [Pseudomonas amygdali]|uniref:type VI secretion system tube protein Hcp n=1 Tax=Pseudomonas amygdali TaxID=47877 RepID=UPI003F696E5E
MDSDCKNWIEINTFCLSASQSVSRTASSAGGATVAKVYLSDFSIVKLADSATPKNPRSMLRRPTYQADEAVCTSCGRRQAKISGVRI